MALRPLGLVLLALLGAARMASAQSVDSTLWVTNGAVNAIVSDAGTIYIGGQFSRVGPATGSGVPLHATSGAPIAGFPKVAGIVRTIVPDGAGGWYLGGSFTSVGGVPRSGVAHLAADLSVTSWNPRMFGGASTGAGMYGYVCAFAVSGSVVYVAGSFDSIGGQARHNLAALDATTGAATAWSPGSNGFFIRRIAVSGSTVYVAGEFTSIGGQTRRHVAALDAMTGLATSWDPQPDADVYALALSDSTVYIGGYFEHVAGQPRNRIAAINTGSNTPTSWDPNSTHPVLDIVVAGSTIYVAGDFLSIGGQPRRAIAALSATSGLATAWNPNPNGRTYALRLSGSTLYAGGGFTSVGGQSRNFIAALDTATGFASAWNPNPNHEVQCLEMNGSVVYAGGVFTSFGGLVRNNIAALDASTGSATSWNPNATAPVRTLAVSGSTLYAGGDFTGIGGQPRNRIAALDVTTGLATAWNPNAIGPVYAIAPSGSTIYVAGNFSQIGGQTRNWIAALDGTSGAATAFNPNANSEVDALAVVGSTVYAGGYFTGIGGQTRNRIAALDATTGAATAWDPNANDNVSAIAVSGSTVYIGGGFTSVDGKLRSHIAALDTTSGHATLWDPGADLDVLGLTVSGTTLYASGDFTTIGGQPRKFIAAFDAASTAVGAWNPRVSPFDPNARVFTKGPTQPFSISALAVSGVTLYVGGDFLGVGGRPQAYAAAIAAAPSLVSSQPASGGNGGEVTVTLSGSGLVAGAEAKLSRSGEPDIIATTFPVASDGMSLGARFDLQDAAVGAWDVVVTTPDLQTATLAGGFTIDSVEGVPLRVDIIGPDVIRTGYPTAFDLVLQNPGNIDALTVPLWIAGIPTSATVTLDFPLADPPQDAGEPVWSMLPDTLTSAGGRYLAMIIPRVPPGTSVRRVYLTVPAPTTFPLTVALTPPWVNNTVFRNCMSAVITNTNCMGSHLTELNDLVSHLGIQAMNGIGVWAKIGWQCEGAFGLAPALAEARQALGFMLQSVEQDSVPTGCGQSLSTTWREVLLVEAGGSIDPNDKFGNRGLDSTITGQDDLTYTIRFENLAGALFPAQHAQVTDVLDADLDLTTLRLGTVTFGKDPTGTPHHCYPEFDRTESRLLNSNLRVDVNVTLIGRTLTWYFNSVNPNGPLPPDAGFLPPNGDHGEGEGSVLFTVKPRNGLPQHTEISNSATIRFDTNPTMTTPAWTNFVDVTPPASHVLTLGSPQIGRSFTVSWAPDSDPADVLNYTLYASEDGGPFLPRLSTPLTFGVFEPRSDDHQPHVYRFYSQARDHVDNREDPPDPPGFDVQTTSTTDVEIEGPPKLALAGARPNPAIGSARIAFTLPSRDPAVLEVIDVAGRRVLRRDVGALGPGSHVVTLDSPRLRAGLYFIRLMHGGQVLRARMVLIR